MTATGETPGARRSPARPRWITGTSDSPAAPLLRQEFAVPGGRRATLRMAALGIADLSINGEPVTPDRLVPGATQYDKTVTVVEWDVSRFLIDERWAVAVSLGRGFFDLPTRTAWLWHEAAWRARPAVWLEIEIDGEPLASTDGDWRAATGGTTSDSLYGGESFDGRLEPDGWRLPGFEDGAWERALVTSYAGGLRPATAPPIRRVARHELRWRKLGNGHWLGDVGRVIAGWVALDSAAPVDARIVHSERLAPACDRVVTGNQFVEGRFQVDEIRAVSEWEARYSYKGFRYLEVTGLEDPGVVTAVEAHADLRPSSEFECSHPTLGWVHEAFRATVLANCHHVVTDSPTYEKNGWTGDVHVAARAILHSLDASAMLLKHLDDLVDAQRESGQLPVIAPTPGWGFDGECAPAPEWCVALPLVALEVAEELGDAAVLARYAGPIRRWLGYELTRLDEKGLAVGVLGDYLAPGYDGPPAEDLRFYSTAHLWVALDRLACSRLELDEELRAFATRHRKGLVTSLNRSFLDADGARYATSADYRQTPSVLALAWGFAPDGLREAMLARLVTDIEERGDHHDVGVFGGAELYGLLAGAGRADLAVRVMANPIAPSFEAWRRAGHSTLLEHWPPLDRSHAHFFQGAGVKWLYEDLAGLRRTAPGWETFRVAPSFPAGIDRVRHSRSTPRGSITVDWEREGDEVAVDIEVQGVMRGRLVVDGVEVEVAEGLTHHTMPTQRAGRSLGPSR